MNTTQNKVTRIFLTFLVNILLLPSVAYAQATIGADIAPNNDAALEIVSNNNKGLLLPRLVLTSLSSAAPMTAHVKGMEVYNTGTALPEGIYVNDGSKWVLTATDGNSVSWNSATTKQPASTNTESIYQMAPVSIGTNQVSANTIFEVSSTSNGVLIPRMTTANRATITTNIPNGLLIYNTTTNCFNYYKTNGAGGDWLSLCGTPEPATFAFVCASATVAGTYKQGVPLVAANTYTIKVNVTKVGAYQIEARTSNGYWFQDSGVFTTTGNQTIVLRGQGVPAKASTADTPALLFNGVSMTLAGGCTLATIKVDASLTKLVIDCNSTQPFGTYIKNTGVSSTTHYVNLKVTGVTTSGQINIITNTINGLTFSSGSVNVTAAGTVTLRASGTPTTVGTYRFVFTVPGTATTCSFDIPVTSSLGNFDNPAKSCLAILNEDATKTDGEYWIRSNGTSVPNKTLCDMTNGGWTLIESISEKSIYGTGTTAGGSQYENARHQQAFTINRTANVVSVQNGAITYENYRLSTPTMQNVKANASGGNQYRVRIVQNKANMTDGTDNWAKDNFIVFDFTGNANYDFLRSTWTGNNYQTNVSGKIFGQTLRATPSGNAYTYTVGSESWKISYPAVWNWPAPTSRATVLSFDAGTTRVPVAQRANFTYTNYDGSNNATVTSTQNIANLNDLGNIYYPETRQVNHHIGKCKNSSSDYDTSTATCSYAAGSRVPHSFNSGEGRYLQWFVK